MAWSIRVIASLLLFRLSSALDFEKCVQTFHNDRSDLDQQRFQGYWYTKYSYLPYHPGFLPMDAQSIYIYMPGDSVGVWYIASAMSIMDGLCYRRIIKVPEATQGARMFKEFTYFHHVIDTDYDNYAVILVCLGISPPGRCEYRDIQTVILSRTPGNVTESSLWSRVKAVIKDCAHPSRLKEIEHENICACSNPDDFTLGLGRVCPEKVPKI